MATKWQPNGNQMATKWQPNGNQMAPQDSIGKLSIDKDSIDKVSKGKNNTFVPPTVDEVRDYCFERNNSVDPEEFVDFYTSKGWLIGKNKMKDWKAAVRTWERSSKPKKKETNVFDEWRNA